MKVLAVVAFMVAVVSVLAIAGPLISGWLVNFGVQS